jgi:nicotinate-nucleotide adenylyltransferase
MGLPDVKEGAKIGIFGGSFDPPHAGHILMMTSVFMRTDLDQIWILPTADHAFKDDQTPFEHRLEMTSRAFEDLCDAHAVPLERHLPSPNYTVETLSWIKERLPEAGLHFIVGGDLVDEIPHWENAEGLTDLSQIMVVPRQGYPVVDPPEELGDFQKVELGVDLPEVSSTKIRNLTARGGSVEPLVSKSVHEYIEKHELY